MRALSQTNQNPHPDPLPKGEGKIFAAAANNDNHTGPSMDQKGILYLSNNDVKKVLDLGRAIEITEQALRDHSEGRVTWSTPEDFAIKPEQGWQSWVTGCALQTSPVAGFRIRSIKAAGGSRDVSRPPRGPRRDADTQRSGRRRDPRLHG